MCKCDLLHECTGDDQVLRHAFSLICGIGSLNASKDSMWMVLIRSGTGLSSDSCGVGGFQLWTFGLGLGLEEFIFGSL
jgi:hypothetical protein